MRTAAIVSGLFFAVPAFASGVDKAFVPGLNLNQGISASEGQVQKKADRKQAPRKVLFDTLKGGTQTTRLPDTARNDARGGVFI